MSEQQNQDQDPQALPAKTVSTNNLDILRANNNPYKIWLMGELNRGANACNSGAFNIRTLAFVKGYITRTTMYDIWDNIKVRKQSHQVTFTYNSDFDDIVLKSDNILASQLAIAILEKDGHCLFVDISKLTDCGFKENRIYFFLGNVERIEHGIPCLFAKVTSAAFNLEYDLFIKTRYLMEKFVYPYGPAGNNKKPEGKIGVAGIEEEVPLTPCEPNFGNQQKSTFFLN
jgi:hypothetical protein